jgi:hypothetical protein
MRFEVLKSSRTHSPWKALIQKKENSKPKKPADLEQILGKSSVAV